MTAPPPPAGLHPLALSWYESLATSGQAQFYEPSDWSQAAIIAHTITRFVASRRVSGQLLAVIFSGMGDLLTTEGARRRARMEIDRHTAPEERPVPLVDYRAALSKGGRRGGRGAG